MPCLGAFGLPEMLICFVESFVPLPVLEGSFNIYFYVGFSSADINI